MVAFLKWWPKCLQKCNKYTCVLCVLISCPGFIFSLLERCHCSQSGIIFVFSVLVFYRCYVLLRICCNPLQLCFNGHLPYWHRHIEPAPFLPFVLTSGTVAPICTYSTSVANRQVRSGELLEVQLVSRWQSSPPWRKELLWEWTWHCALLKPFPSLNPLSLGSTPAWSWQAPFHRTALPPAGPLPTGCLAKQLSSVGFEGFSSCSIAWSLRPSLDPASVFSALSLPTDISAASSDSSFGKSLARFTRACVEFKHADFS